MQALPSSLPGMETVTGSPEETEALAARLAAQLRGQRMLAAVFLVRALGGDWAGASSLAAGGEVPAR